MCFSGTCDGCGKTSVGRAYHCGYHLCTSCTADLPVPEPTEAELAELKRILNTK